MAHCCSEDHELPPGTPLLTVDSLCEKLKLAGMRITKGRRAILHALFSAGHPVTLQELQGLSLRFVDEAPDYATVFRLLVLLEELGHVHKVNLHKSCSYYELHQPGRHYDHLVCERCGKVLLLELPCPVRETESWIKEKLGYSGLSHSLEFFGVCPGCRGEPPVGEGIPSESQRKLDRRGSIGA